MFSKFSFLINCTCALHSLMESKIVLNAVHTMVLLPYKAQGQPQLELQSPVMRSVYSQHKYSSVHSNILHNTDMKK